MIENNNISIKSELISELINVINRQITTYRSALKIIESALNRQNDTADNEPGPNKFACHLIQKAGFKEIHDILEGFIDFEATDMSSYIRYFIDDVEKPYRDDYIDDPVWETELNNIAFAEVYELESDFHSCIFRRADDLKWLFAPETIKKINEDISLYEAHYNDAAEFFSKIETLQRIVADTYVFIDTIDSLQTSIYQFYSVLQRE